MTVVVDATAIVAVVTNTNSVDRHLVSATRVLAPDLAVAEVLNVRWKYRRAELAAPSIDVILAFFDRITLVPSRDYAIDADRLSLEIDHPIYDCLYAAVAMREDAKLVTADRRLARKLGKQKIGVAVFA